VAGDLILVVDDDPDIREALQDALEDEGYSVLLAANGAEALTALASRAPPSLILLDLMMPVMDGFTFRAKQLEDPRFASVPVVIVSAGGDIMKHARQLGVAGYIEKPMSRAAVLREVARRSRSCLAQINVQ
jgi:CheY-like chemotaxis protein